MTKFRVTYEAVIDLKNTFTYEIEAENEAEARRDASCKAGDDACDWEMTFAYEMMSDLWCIEVTKIEETDQ